MVAEHAVILLSGGLDSVAAMHWARENFGTVEALLFDYGQANRDAELEAAHAVATRRGVPSTLYHLGDAVRGHSCLKPATPGLVSPGVSRANLPYRNAILLACAAAHAGRARPDQPTAIVIGATADDAPGFPDCRRDFTDAMSLALAAALPSHSLKLAVPWQQMSKADVLRWCAARPDALDDVRSSVSCYAGTRCGACDPCALRSRAFASNLLADS